MNMYFTASSTRDVISRLLIYHTEFTAAAASPLLTIIHISTVRMRPIFGAFVEVGLELTVPTVPDPVVAIFALVRLVGLDFEDPLADVDCVVAEVLVGCASA